MRRTAGRSVGRLLGLGWIALLAVWPWVALAHSPEPARAAHHHHQPRPSQHHQSSTTDECCDLCPGACAVTLPPAKPVQWQPQVALASPRQEHRSPAATIRPRLYPPSPLPLAPPIGSRV